jgi:hypothetical protein
VPPHARGTPSALDLQMEERRDEIEHIEEEEIKNEWR